MDYESGIPIYKRKNYESGIPINKSMNYESGIPVCKSMNYESGIPVCKSMNYESGIPVYKSMTYEYFSEVLITIGIFSEKSWILIILFLKGVFAKNEKWIEFYGDCF